MTRLKPLNNRVVLKTLSPESMTKSGLIIPEMAQEKPTIGEIVAHIYRPCCIECDIELNELVLKFMRFLDWEEKMIEYKNKKLAERCYI